ncbi:hypothetical protein J8L70_01995 [Pseudoalteromonas sp. MMG010]|uniref:hypothetical protein n=1 Tax=Pseudoalteromonas sp. MMG010 TaxID=2822685 RepID=UPI001B39D148|nr:hypothetical protein [Pseudoalteromonas sp. MMG010]MBQ4832003.1 hypothetical protein [Pseudoalteromonas sp. MMG010]
MFRILFFSVLCLLISACTSIRFGTNVTSDILQTQIIEHVARRDLYQFMDDQSAHESGARLLGRVQGESCYGTNQSPADARSSKSNRNIGYEFAYSQATERLKANVINIDGNAYTINQCRKVALGRCDIAIQCYGQAYSY